MSFRTLISTAWIKVVYAIGAALITVASIGALLIGGRVMGGGAVLLGLVYFVAGNVAWRMVCEAAILFFSMHEQLVKLVQLSGGRAAPLSATPTAAPAPSFAPADSPCVSAATTPEASFQREVAGYCPSCGAALQAGILYRRCWKCDAPLSE
jgi:hypothetical protein